MVKPSHFGGYSDAYTVDCERVLVTLLRGLGAPAVGVNIQPTSGK